MVPFGLVFSIPETWLGIGTGSMASAIFSDLIMGTWSSMLFWMVTSFSFPFSTDVIMIFPSIPWGGGGGDSGAPPRPRGGTRRPIALKTGTALVLIAFRSLSQGELARPPLFFSISPEETFGGVVSGLRGPVGEYVESRAVDVRVRRTMRNCWSYTYRSMYKTTADQFIINLSK